MNNDTICALATAIGGAIGIIRVSGDKALKCLSPIFTKDLSKVKPNTIHYGHVKDGDVIVDEVLVSAFLAPHSYTGEDSLEISCHGSRYILNKVLALLVENGCRMAAPGEFTMRAYLNGKMDLSQAEAVADLIASTNKATHQIAMSQLRGHFSSELKNLRSQLLKLTSLLELELDFSDHEDLEFADRSDLMTLAQQINSHISKLTRSFETGQALKEGFPVAIVGKTNVGKSTLLNRLLHDDRAIVSDIHGTTRDTIEDTIDIHGVTFRFIDTAGIRQTSDKVEQIGIKRTFDAISKVRIVLWLLDTAPTKEETNEMVERSKGRALLPIINKADTLLSSSNVSQTFHDIDIIKMTRDAFQACDFSLLPQFPLLISAKNGQGIDSLEQAIYAAVDLPTLSDTDVIVSSMRHYQSLITARDNLSRVIDGLHQEISGDLLSEDLRLVLSNLSEITGDGQITPQETLNNIFKHFCVGK